MIEINKNKSDFEIDYLLEAIFQRYGYDFRNYARASLKRRIQQRVWSSGLSHISEMIPKILHEDDFFELFLADVSITVTEIFRNPEVFKSIRETVIPKLKTYPHVNIWIVGCATGEEAYSMAILIEEANLAKKTRIYATDFNNRSLEKAEKGLYSLEDMTKNSNNYIKSGGNGVLSDYYRTSYNFAKMKDSLREIITFANHNLMQDTVFAEMNLILCRNVLIYFKKNLQNRVLTMLRDSLVHRGFLVLGDRETIDFSAVSNEFETFSKKERIFRRKRRV